MLILGRGPSARALRAAVRGLPWGTTTAAPRYEPAVCWGKALETFSRHNQEGRPVLNRRIIFDKLEQLQRFFYQGILAPDFLFLEDQDPMPVYTSQWLARRRFHQRGHDIHGPYNTERMREILQQGRADYGVQLIEKTKEWRVHVFRGEVLRIARKVWVGAGDIPTHPVWNQERGWHYRYQVDLADTTRRNLEGLAKRAVVALGQDFGAVDIIRDCRKNYYVLEVNSAPGIIANPNTLAAYAEALKKWGESVEN